MSGCEHRFQNDGIRYAIDPSPRPGTGAKTRDYYRAYVCERCLYTRYIQLSHSDTTYDSVQFGATPMPEGARP